MPLLTVTSLINTARRLIRRTEGQDLIEYSLLIGIITVGVVLSVQSAADIVDQMFAALLDILNGTV
jgi:Flp pilus assembly pilin Flp